MTSFVYSITVYWGWGGSGFFSYTGRSCDRTRRRLHRSFMQRPSLSIHDFEPPHPMNASGRGADQIISQGVPAFVRLGARDGLGYISCRGPYKANPKI